ncbi:oxygenase MpaB family protein [Myxococcus landrumensis]|uniref:DUF2236 domain-containing protein n=1 Tax=Myxococcus landrumensis TaxID=2813577 RepID=A0ABX7N0N2_9BACT|nr:oxygenase MpaB family protein [Myxococcus landrumus]QSQ12260.1 DUF2236 domain-containing protein [Myxococcus landrumus]
MRGIGDPVVDGLVVEHLATRAPESLEHLLRDLFRMQRLPAGEPWVLRYLAALPRNDLVDPEVITRGQRVFGLYGPEVLMILGSYSLHLAYAAGHGVQAVYRSRRLKDDPLRRLCDTAQMVINVMQPGGLAEGGIGWLATRKVRLIHALIRHRLLSDTSNPWLAEWGVPINQEDQAGTLLTFSIATLDGLRKMGVKVSSSEATAYIRAWSAVGQLLGVEASLLPSNEEEAMALARHISQRHVRSTPEGRHLAEQLLSSIQTLYPVPGYAVSLTHFFLQDAVFGNDVVAALDIPKPNWTKWLVAARARQKRVALRASRWVPGARRRRSWIARHFAQRMILFLRPDAHTPFEVPPAFKRCWGLEEHSLT